MDRNPFANFSQANMGESKSTRSGILQHAAAGLFFFGVVQIILSIVVISTAVILLSSLKL